MEISNMTSEKLNVLLNARAIQPPPGDAHSTGNPYSAVAYTTITICLLVPTTAVAGRTYTRLRILQNMGLEDYTCILAWLFLIIYIALFTAALHAGFGLRPGDPNLGQSTHLNQILYFLEALYGPVSYFTKISILLQYLRVLVPRRLGNQLLFYGIHLTIWANTLFYGAAGLVLAIGCSPKQTNWDLLASRSSTVNFSALFITTAAINVVSDVSILLLPISSLWNLQISRQGKATIAAVIGVGLLVCAMSIKRLVYAIDLMKTRDRTTFELMALWTLAEISIGIICGCLPVLPCLYKHCKPKLVAILPFRWPAPGQIFTCSSFPQSPYPKASFQWDSPTPPQKRMANFHPLDWTSVPMAAVEFPPRSYWSNERFCRGLERELDEGILTSDTLRVFSADAEQEDIPLEQDRPPQNLLESMATVGLGIRL